MKPLLLLLLLLLLDHSKVHRLLSSYTLLSFIVRMIASCPVAMSASSTAGEKQSEQSSVIVFKNSTSHDNNCRYRGSEIIGVQVCAQVWVHAMNACSCTTLIHNQCCPQAIHNMLTIKNTKFMASNRITKYRICGLSYRQMQKKKQNRNRCCHQNTKRRFGLHHRLTKPPPPSSSSSEFD